MQKALEKALADYLDDKNDTLFLSRLRKIAEQLNLNHPIDEECLYLSGIRNLLKAMGYQLIPQPLSK